jgi:hypothetical protein
MSLKYRVNLVNQKVEVMLSEYIELTVKVLNKVHGKVSFNAGEGDPEYYINRAKILAQPYLFTDPSNSGISYDTKVISIKSPKIIELYIPAIT